MSEYLLALVSSRDAVALSRSNDWYGGDRETLKYWILE